MKEFTSDRTFKIWAYTISHNFLIIRSPMLFEDMNGYNEILNYNIDIEFTAVIYMNIPSVLSGFKIKELKNNIPDLYKIYDDFKVYEIESNGNKYYIVAGNYPIGTNKWLFEHRITDMTLQYDNILTTSRKDDISD